jgi:adenylosuccinate synthase
MTVSVVIGLQWGDEAKGKMVDLLCQDADVVARFNGGDNAGHTVVNQFGTFKLRLTPNGIANPKTHCMIGPGVVVNLNTLLGELDYIRSAGIEMESRLWVSPRCHVVMPYHPMVEGIYEDAKGSSKTGTTRRGMGPVYADKVSYNGIRLADFADEARLRAKLAVQIKLKNALFAAHGIDLLDLETVLSDYLQKFQRISSMVREPFGYLQEALTSGANIVMEGAQGALLDNDWGTYPYCTASTTTAGGACAGLGIAPGWIERVIGVAKAYTSRVGSGPMPTELLDEMGQALRDEGQEYGTVTGRPRRCGWLDMDLVRFTCQLNGCTELALTKLDVLDKLPMIKIGVGYRHPGAPERIAHYWEGDAHWLEECEPVYIEMEGWQKSTRLVRRFDDLPAQAQAYVRKVEELAGVSVSFVSVGAEREEIIRLG